VPVLGAVAAASFTLYDALDAYAADDETARRLRADWLDATTAAACETWPASPESAALMLAACRRAIERRM
jgi:hypothetical protein